MRGRRKVGRYHRAAACVLLWSLTGCSQCVTQPPQRADLRCDEDTVKNPDPDDPFIAEHGDPERLAWMRANFTDHARVAGERLETRAGWTPFEGMEVMGAVERVVLRGMEMVRDGGVVEGAGASQVIRPVA